MAAIAIARAATKISALSNPLEKYSTFVWPKACSSSGGRAAMVSAQYAATAATRLITDSAASENKPTELVSKYAANFKLIVRTAAPMESRAKARGEAPGDRASLLVLFAA